MKLYAVVLFILLTVIWIAEFLGSQHPDCGGMALELHELQDVKSTEARLKYYELRNTFEVECGEDRGDTFLSQ